MNLILKKIFMYVLTYTIITCSFHVGSGCYDPFALPKAVAAARIAFDMGAKAGYKFNFLDIGGGFPGDKSASKITFPEV